MGFIAIIGAGPLGGAVAHKLAARDRIAEVRLIDPEGRIAEGKALDIRQSSPIESFSSQVTGATSFKAAVGADVIVLADEAAKGTEYSGESGLALVRELLRAGSSAPMVCAGAAQRDLMAKAVTELRMPRARLIGSAPAALESALRAIAGLQLDGSGVEVCLRVVGVPPRAAVVAWEEATVAGQPLSSHLPAHVVAALNSRIPGLWPPGPYVLASAAARVVEALVNGSRRRYSCFVALDRGAMRDAVAAMPVILGPSGIARIVEPTLTRQEQTMLENAIERVP